MVTPAGQKKEDEKEREKKDHDRKMARRAARCVAMLHQQALNRRGQSGFGTATHANERPMPENGEVKSSSITQDPKRTNGDASLDASGGSRVLEDWPLSMEEGEL